MKILAVECSSDIRGVALLDSAQPAGQRLRGRASEQGGRSCQLLTLVEQALAQAGWQRADLETVAVGTGPGSYHGIRAAIAFAQGWQFARDVRLQGISSVECLAAQARAQGLTGPVSIVIDAQRQELYHARYELAPDGLRLLEPLHIAPLAEVRQHIPAGEPVLGPEATRWFPDGQALAPDAAILAELAAARPDATAPGETLEPVYLRATTFVKAPPPRLIPPLS